MEHDECGWVGEHFFQVQFKLLLSVARLLNYAFFGHEAVVMLQEMERKTQ